MNYDKLVIERRSTSRYKVEAFFQFQNDGGNAPDWEREVDGILIAGMDVEFADGSKITLSGHGLRQAEVKFRRERRFNGEPGTELRIEPDTDETPTFTVEQV